MAKLTLNDITSGYATVAALNANNTAIEAALENTLSRDGTSPNQMGADLDMNSYNILNTSSLDVQSLLINGVPVIPTGVVGSELPNQLTHAGKFLQTNGSLASWQVPDATEVSFTQAGIGAVATTVDDKLNQFVSVLDFGATGNGTTNDAAACVLADTAASSGGVIYPAGVYYIDTNTTLTAPITMMPGARFKVNAGKTLTINAPIYAGSRQYIFEGASGAIAGTFGYVDLWVDWFGAVPDSSISATPTGTDSGVGFNKAITAAKHGTADVRTIRANPGVYLIETEVHCPTQGISIIGSGKYISFLTCKAAYAADVVQLDGTAGNPNMFRGFGIISAVGGAFGANGINATSNGVILSDLWVSGFSKGIIMASTDQWLTDFVVEYNTEGVVVTSGNVDVSHGETFLNTYSGLTVTAILESAGTQVVVSNVRAVNEPARGFVCNAASNVLFDGCTCVADTGGVFDVAGFIVYGVGKNVTLDGCVVMMPSASVGIGYSITDVDNVNLTGCTAKYMDKGVYINTASNVSVNGGAFLSNTVYGIEAVDYNFLTVANTQCVVNGTAAAADAGIKITANRAAQRLLLNGNQCHSTGGGVQEYGIRVTCTNATSYGLVANNMASFNTTNNILIDGANAANITQANNVVA